ncbi:hypothetical protein [Anaeromyxobacter oryzae]|uniref:Uncharacterized protein n=1 Tax=Anaeromyxobacter oryzae TaxID=2918170 RepID=A0ABM7X2J0_9BACT|nr:hypothetical protein [Anaeromyxobacter oryzae]BDG06015.1 hypothetical protein AMOR_50110 [Anaeromyxobacter oryzae]
MVAVVVTLPHAADPTATLAFAAGFAVAAGVAGWIVLAMRLVARHRSGGPRGR